MNWFFLQVLWQLNSLTNTLMSMSVKTNMANCHKEGPREVSKWTETKVETETIWFCISNVDSLP